MFQSTPAKAVVVLLLVIGILQFMAKETVEKQAEANSAFEEQARLRYEERLQERQGQKGEVMMQQAKHQVEVDNHHTKIKIGGYLSDIKNKVIQYKRKHNEWPEDMSDLGLQSEKAADGRYIQSIKIDDGDIYAFLPEGYGSKKIVALIHVDGREVMYPWVCSTNLKLKKKTSFANAECSYDEYISFSGRYIQ